MWKFKIPNFPPTSSKSIRFPNNMVNELGREIVEKTAPLPPLLRRWYGLLWKIWRKKNNSKFFRTYVHFLDFTASECYNSVTLHYCIQLYTIIHSEDEVANMIEINPKSNLLEEKTYRYTLQDVPEPRHIRDK